jgi:S-DNA-T family DNA segregation ATPase FtsK/SpoIIIE
MNLIINQLVTNQPKALCIFIDIKRVELSRYKNIKQCYKYCNDIESARHALNIAYITMMNEYQYMEKNGLTKTNKTPLFIFIDEYADLILQDRNIEKIIASIARLGRAAGIHLIIATQYPTREIISTQIKINCPVRICFRLNRTGSMVVLDKTGAETLQGPGYGILLYSNGQYYNFKSTMLTDSEINDFIERNKKQKPKRKTFSEIITNILTA